MKTILIICSILIVLAVAVYFKIRSDIRDAYAQENVASLVIQYLENNNNSWPQNWNDLEKEYKKLRNCPWTFEFLKSRVDVYFDIDIKIFTKNNAGKFSFKVMGLKNSKSTHWQNFEANEMIYRYLNKKKI